jgi:palmitoyl-protein thioesterase
MITISIFLTLFIVINGLNDSTNIPIVGIHGIFSNTTLLNDFAEFVSNGTDRQFINLEYGIFEKIASITPLYDQINDLCTLMYFNKDIRNAEQLDFVGLSQGGLIMKGLIQNCKWLNVRYFVTIVTPNSGIYYPNNSINELIDFYSEESQKHLSFAGYYRDPTKYLTYLLNSEFLAKANNELFTIDSVMNKQQMLKLKNHMTVYSTNDTVISPYGSPMYDLYEYINETVMYVPRENTYAYQNDILGIRTLYETNRFHIIQTNCSHEDHKEKICFPQLQPIIDFLIGLYD